MQDGKKLLSLVICLLLMATLIGCATKLVLHPILGTDIYSGTQPGDVCFTSYYINEVMQAKIEGR